MDKPIDYLMNERQAAQFLGMNISTLQGWRCTGLGPKYVKFAKAVRYSCTDLLEFIEERKRLHTSEDEGPRAKRRRRMRNDVYASLSAGNSDTAYPSGW